MTLQKTPVLSVETHWSDKWRAQSLKDVQGQEKALRIMAGLLKSGKIPQTILITGESGTGKSTLARLIAKRLDPTGANIFESNAAKESGIDAIRDIIESAKFKPMVGNLKIYVIDESHGLTNKAGSAALSFLEAPPEHVVVIMTTNEPYGMLKTLRDRAKQIPLQPLTSEAIKKILLRVAEGESIFQPAEEHDALFNALSRIFTGSARPAIDALHNLSLIAATRPLNKADLANEVNRVLQFDYRDSARFINLWYKSDNSAIQILSSIEDPAAFSTLLCNIHYYLLKKAVGLNPSFDYLGTAAEKGLGKIPVSLLQENFETCMTIRATILNPGGRNPHHILLSGCLKLKSAKQG